MKLSIALIAAIIFGTTLGCKARSTNAGATRVASSDIDVDKYYHATDKIVYDKNDIVDISSTEYGLYILTQDGTVWLYYEDEKGTEEITAENYKKITQGAKKISVSKSNGSIVALKSDGIWAFNDNGSDPTQLYKGSDAKDIHNIVNSGVNGWFTTVYATNKGVFIYENKDNPYKLANYGNVKKLMVGYGVMVFNLTEDGQVKKVYASDTKYKQGEAPVMKNTELIVYKNGDAKNIEITSNSFGADTLNVAYIVLNDGSVVEYTDDQFAYRLGKASHLEVNNAAAVTASPGSSNQVFVLTNDGNILRKDSQGSFVSVYDKGDALQLAATETMFFVRTKSGQVKMFGEHIW